MKYRGIKTASAAMLVLSASMVGAAEEIKKAKDVFTGPREAWENARKTEWGTHAPIRVRPEGRKLTKAEKKAAKKQQTFKRLVMEFGD